MPERDRPAAYTLPEPLPDTWLLCGECGAVTHQKWWSYWKYDDEGEQLVPIEDGDDDPIMRCPACKHDHRDDDGDSGIWDGTHDEMAAERAIQAPDMFDGWLATAEELGARKARKVTDEMIERGATAVAELLGHGPFAVLDHAMDRQIAEDVLRAALEVPDGQ